MKPQLKPCALAASVILGSLLAGQIQASSHREAPNITRYPTVDSTDFYMFNSYEADRADYVTLIANYVPLQDAYGGPNYFALDPAAKYNIHIDSDGDAKEDLTFQFDFSQKLAGDTGGGTKLSIGDGDDAKDVAIPLKNSKPLTATDSSGLNFIETYSLKTITGELATGEMEDVTAATGGEKEFTKPYDYIGEKTFTDYQAYADQYQYDITIPGCNTPGKVFVGQRKESFKVNLGEVFDLVNLVPIDSSSFTGGITQDVANDDLADKNVTSLALEVPKACLTGADENNGVIGAWTTAQIPQVRIQNPDATFEKPEVNGGAMTQISRLGNPLVNELVIGLPDKDKFSTSAPADDGQFLDYVTHPTLPALLDSLFKDAVNTTLSTNFETIAPTNIPRNDLVAAFLTGVKSVNQQTTVTPSEMLRLNTTIDAKVAADQMSLGVIAGDSAGFPNGRRPGDDVVDIALRVVMGRLCHLDANADQEALAAEMCGTDPKDQANVGTAEFTDGAPITAADFDNSFPYLTTPLPGATSN